MKNFLTIFFSLFACHLFAQDSTQNKNPLTISGYAEVYYSYDFNNPSNNAKPSFIYNFNRNNEVNLNLGFIKAAYQTDKVRANLSLAAGTYTNANYTAEPGVLKNLFEANAGIKISKKKNLWIDAGIFSSHIGFESAIGSSCWNLTRSIVAENTPYYESGAKISYTSNNTKWFLSALFLNGWQHITRQNFNTTPAFGAQVTFTPSSKFSFNYSTFIGSDTPDSIRKMRYYNNFYAIFQLNKIVSTTVGFDYGLQQKFKGSSSYNNIYSPVIIFKFLLNASNCLALRGEYYNDADGIIVSSNTSNGFKVFGWSINYDRQITNNFVWRTELRNLIGKDDYFTKHDGSLSDNSTFITTSFAVNF